MSESTELFIYRDSRGRITARELQDVSESDEYLQGFCLHASSLRTFRKDRVLEHIADPTLIDERLQYHIAVNPPPKEIIEHGPRKMNRAGKAEICFTGFKKDQKAELTAVAEGAGMFIRTGVTRDLNFLCCGATAGPDKVAKARHQGVVALSEQQFRSLLETGEIPDDE